MKKQIMKKIRKKIKPEDDSRLNTKFEAEHHRPFYEDEEGRHEWYLREGSSNLYGPNGDMSPGGGNLESLHEKYLRDGD